MGLSGGLRVVFNNLIFRYFPGWSQSLRQVPNYMMESIDWGEAIFTMCDLGFRQENHFYEKCSAKHPLELPSMYRIGEEPNPEPAKKMPRASILMSIVEDPAMISQVDGCSESDAKDFLSALARVQATWWNSDEVRALLSPSCPAHFAARIRGS